jgi:hypothetical protein
MAGCHGKLAEVASQWGRRLHRLVRPVVSQLHLPTNITQQQSEKSASRRAPEIEQDETTRVEESVSDDHRPKIPARRENQQTH